MISRAERRRLLIFGFWPLFGAFGGLQIQISMLSHHHSWALVISYQVLVWSLWIPFTFAIIAILRSVPLRRFELGAFLAHLTAAFGLGVVHTLFWVAVEFVLKPYDFMNPTNFRHRLLLVGYYQMPLEFMLYGIVALAHYVDESSERARERERRAAQLETSLAQARLQALELQTQPHFLFNTLNGIGSLVRAGENARALTMIGGLSDLLRYALDRAGGGLVTLAEEAKTVEKYLEIQSHRFPDRLTVATDVSPEVRDAAVPALLLQPLVENAVRHGLARSEAPGRITLGVRREGEWMIIEIFNTGQLDPNRKPGIGLTNTRARLSQLYGDRARLDLDARDGGVLAWVTLPWSRVS
jgi:two-component system, LytTR family, sensor kinase